MEEGTPELSSKRYSSSKHELFRTNTKLPSDVRANRSASKSGSPERERSSKTSHLYRAAEKLVEHFDWREPDKKWK